MLFSEPAFLLFFLPLLFAIYFAVPKVLRNTVLLIFSLGFYAYGEKMFVLLMLFSIALNYGLGLAIDRAATPAAKKFWLIAGIVGDLGLLIAFKYANFLVDNLNSALSVVQLPTVHLDPVHLPIGISFFTFQAMSYIIDLYRGEVKVQRNPFDLALYISLFPQLIAGPIVRYHDISEQLQRRRHSFMNFAYGAERFLIGLGKKMIIANAVAYPCDQIFALPDDEITTSLAWLGMVCYTLQIYFDFSGYSDMAIGLGRMFGFKFLENFNYPYISQSITEFWRRWHISLSSWYRDYLYIPLGGNRVSPRRTYFNLFTVFFLCGLWHGSSWNFVIWGMYHGLFLIIERLGFGAMLKKGPRAVRHIYCMLAAVIGWVFFRAETLPQSLTFIAAMFGFGSDPSGARLLGHYLDTELLVMIVIGMIGATNIVPAGTARLKSYVAGKEKAQRATWENLFALLKWAALTAIFFWCLMMMAAGSYNPFIYFRF
ncbi:MBOAT family O-acyltransferase [Acanthopleuribacter pedis]|uniref:MBOAT family protein n=1 Tax=Acanthopleuribacter pedis TaxID=442870 RepID=A0A8J7QE46_9BACT|nr:MBOAT family protein [Acanthopleuribacter pedis]MBO1319286.1 MBOAT family protein [Acanthopleuribacter pedis]